MNDVLSELKKIYDSHTLPEHDDLLEQVDGGVSVLEHEDGSYRPKAKTSDAGGLLDFTAAQGLPLVVVPDLHARCDFFLHLMEFPLACAQTLTVLDALEKGLVRVVCVGDLFHSEGRGRERWLSAWENYEAGDYESSEMTAEMLENLTLFQMVLLVKKRFPAHFHFLKGNHENMLNEWGRGNYPFRKFADEGGMVYDFMASHYGDAVLHLMGLWEHLLPVCAAFPQCVVTHAEPQSVYTRAQFVDYQKHPDVVLGLTWTANGEAEDGSVEKNLRTLLGKERAETAVWLSGHRPVHGSYALRQNGKLIQIHNPEREQVAIALPEKQFSPATDVVIVSASE
ncbi:MAG: metallophosphoesterase [Treponema sp.]|nr:metallophosphoesterase [Treponema sp.]